MRTLRPWWTAVAVLVLTALVVPASPSATAAAPTSTHRSVRAVIEPPLPVEQFPGQVKNACGVWRELQWPSAEQAVDYPVAHTALVIRGSNRYYNRSADLPADGDYREYDVNPRPPGAHRDAERLVRDVESRTVWYTHDHYDNFQQIAAGCP